MSTDTFLDTTRIAWLTLAFMMLLSRVVFQAAGAVWMRSFLDRWQAGWVKRVWGAIALTFAAFLLVSVPSVWHELSTFDAVLVIGLVGVLIADGLTNVLPAGFETFKSRVQDAWVARQRGTGRAGDPYLFAVGNALLGLGAAATAAVVILYRPIEVASIVLAAAAAILLTIGLVAAATQSKTPEK